MWVASRLKVRQLGRMGTPTFDLYLDDSGIRFPDKSPTLQRRDGMDYFALGGLLVESEKLHDLIESYNQLAERHGITYPLHSHKIRTKKQEFRWLASEPNRAKLFYEDLERFICSVPGHVIACCIDRPCYNSRYAEQYGKDRWKLCKSAYTIVVERAAKFSMKHGRRLIVYIEHTGKKENGDIRNYHRSMIDAGMYFDKGRSERYGPLSGEDFAKVLMKNPNFINKDNKAAQIADLVLYPIVKGGYDPTYPPYVKLAEAQKLIDASLDESERKSMGIKYYCFDRGLVAS